MWKKRQESLKLKLKDFISEFKPKVKSKDGEFVDVHFMACWNFHLLST